MVKVTVTNFGFVQYSMSNMHEQAVRVATRYAPAPLLPRGRPSASRASVQAQRSSSFPRPVRSHGHRCTCLTR